MLPKKSFRIGRVGPVRGDWTLSVIGRNLLTFTDYKGYDPEVGNTTSESRRSSTHAMASSCSGRKRS